MKLVYFLDLPVYRVSEDRYYDERESHVVKSICQAEIEINEMTETQSYLYEKQSPVLSERYGGVWEYNEIVGYIKLHFLGEQVRGEYFTTKPYRKVRTRRKLFVYSTHKLAPEVNLEKDSDNSQIYEKLIEYVELCRCELPSRYIDDRYIKLIGPHLDWNLLKSNAIGSYQSKIS